MIDHTSDDWKTTLQKLVVSSPWVAATFLVLGFLGFTYRELELMRIDQHRRFIDVLQKIDEREAQEHELTKRFVQALEQVVANDRRNP